jgi:hypothetical protein
LECDANRLQLAVLRRPPRPRERPLRGAVQSFIIAKQRTVPDPQLTSRIPRELRNASNSGLVKALGLHFEMILTPDLTRPKQHWAMDDFYCFEIVNEEESDDGVDNRWAS